MEKSSNAEKTGKRTTERVPIKSHKPEHGAGRVDDPTLSTFLHQVVTYPDLFLQRSPHVEIDEPAKFEFFRKVLKKLQKPGCTL